MGEIAKNKNFEQLVEQVVALIETGRNNVRKVVNTSMVYTYYGVGYYIVEFEQGGKVRAEYGKETLKQLSARLTDIYGDGWSVDNLEKSRKFFMLYSNSATALRKSEEKEIRNIVAEIGTSELVHKAQIQKGYTVCIQFQHPHFHQLYHGVTT